MGEVTFPIQESSASQDSVLTGNIKVELLSIALPAGGLEFQVDTQKEFSLSSPGNQFRDADFPIINYSKVPIQVEISQVAEITEADTSFTDPFTDQVRQSFTLVDQLSKAGAPGTAILALGVTGHTYQSTQEFEQHALIPGRKTSIYLAEIPAEGTQTFSLYGKVGPDFFGAYQFTVRPTLKVSTAR